MRLLSAIGLLWLVLSTVEGLRAQALPPLQEPAMSNDDQSGDGGDDPNQMRRIGSSMSRPAEFQGPGWVQVEWGFDESLRGPDLRRDLASTFSMGFAVSDRFLAEFSWDNVAAQTDWQGRRARGAGDSGVGLQSTLIDERRRRPALALVYFAKLPSASSRHGLGSGKIDQKLALLASKQIGANQVDFNIGLLLEGREPPLRTGRGSLVAVSVTRNLLGRLGVQGEYAHLTLDSDLPKGSYVLAALNFQARSRLQLDGGVRFGLTRETPDVGLFTGVNILVGNIYRRGRP